MITEGHFQNQLLLIPHLFPSTHPFVYPRKLSVERELRMPETCSPLPLVHIMQTRRVLGLRNRFVLPENPLAVWASPILSMLMASAICNQGPPRRTAQDDNHRHHQERQWLRRVSHLVSPPHNMIKIDQVTIAKSSCCFPMAPSLPVQSLWHRLRRDKP